MRSSDGRNRFSFGARGGAHAQPGRALKYALTAVFLSALGIGASLFGATVGFAWTTSPGADGYLLSVSSNSPAVSSPALKFTASTNLVRVSIPAGTWFAQVQAWDTVTNQATNVSRLYSDPSNEVQFYIPPGPGSLTIDVDKPFQVPVYTLTTNAVVRITAYLQKSYDLRIWSDFIPLLAWNAGDGTNANYRVRLTVQRLPL